MADGMTPVEQQMNIFLDQKVVFDWNGFHDVFKVNTQPDFDACIKEGTTVS